jgi:hypothetical protein
VRGGLVACLLLCAQVARADDVDDLVAQGETLAKQGEWTRAISAFKQADAKRPRAKHACLISLAYTRRELWAEAELFLSICRQRAGGDDAAPDWLDEAQRTLTEKLAAAGTAPVAITVEPPDAVALVSVSSFAPDETFPPRTIHLPPGTHVISAHAPGYKPARQEITISSGAPQDVKLVLVSEHSDTPIPQRHSHSRVPRYLLVAGGALAFGGLAFDIFIVRPAYDDLSNAGTNTEYYARKGTFDDRRDVAIALYAGAGLLIAAGAVLHYTVFSEPSAVHVGAALAPQGGMVTLEWSR